MPSVPVSDPLWTVPDLVAATGGRLDGGSSRGISGISIDTRSLVPGDLFVALKDQRDGHDFVTAAFERGASAALVANAYARQPGDGCLLRVADTLEGLRGIGAAARARLADAARVIAVTGSAGKTGTTAMLRACLSAIGPTHAPEKSFNNHWGVPLTLARMPGDTAFAVIEIGMNHADEIRPLTRLARPHIAVVTNVLAVHVGNFADGEIGVARAKSEIFEGLEPDGIAILPRDNPHCERLADAARRCGARVATFGASAEADIRAIRLEPEGGGRRVTLATGESWYVASPGVHIATNALAVAAVLQQLDGSTKTGLDVEAALAMIANVQPSAGRGRQERYRVARSAGAPPADILLIDESYNANPASMRAALAVLGTTEPRGGGRRIAVMGDMLELGAPAQSLHRELCDAVETARVDLVFACGPLMRGLYEALPEPRRGAWREKSSDLAAAVVESLATGDVVMVKGSLGTNMAPIIRAITMG
jgi:UDP-N-acetylmuramoyl-tripeptide--D-alanyl-D-alanine ligase